MHITESFKHYSGLPSEVSTWVDLLRWRSQHQPNQTAFTFLSDGEVATEQLTYGELDRRSRAIAAALQALNLSGERALLLYPPGLEYLVAFFGCLYAGVVAVPAYPPRNLRNTSRIQAISQDAEAAIALTTRATVSTLQSLLISAGDFQELRWLTTDDVQPGTETTWIHPGSDRETLAFLQYTSGSTGTPKGVMLSHNNLMHNAAVTYQWMGHSAHSRFVSWLPLYHDMGLIGGILQPLYGGFPCVLMPPVAFLQRPYRWLKAIADYGATTSGAPNFAYELCIQKITSEQRQTLDLSTWQVAFNGAEPLRAETLKDFSDAFAPCGFRQEALYPCYGLAEGALMVTGNRFAHPPVVQPVQKSALEQGRAIRATCNAGTAPQAIEAVQTLVSSGRCLSDQRIAIVAPDTLTCCLDNQVGEIWVKGPSIGKGYWQRAQETEETFQAVLADTGEGSFLRTGDLGFLQNEELFVTGRLKDVIIIRGRNLYPQDIERTAEISHPAVRVTGAAAFTIEVDDEERLVVGQELEFRQKPDLDEVVCAIRQAVAEAHEVEVYAVVLLKPGSIPKTSSGKIQRRACREEFLADRLQVLHQSTLEQTEEVSPEDRTILLGRDILLAIAPETRTAKLWEYLQSQIARSLHVSPVLVQPDQPISRLGLDSLRVFELKNQIEHDFSVELCVADLFDGITPAQLSQQILGQLSTVNSSKLLQSIPARPAQLALSFEQEQLFFLHQLQPDSPAYNIAIAVQLTGDLTVTALERSLQALCNRHEALRSSFKRVDGNPIQVIAHTVAPTLQPLDLQHLGASEQAEAVHQITTETAQTPFDLSQAPLLRATLLQLSSESYLLLLTLHHLIFDGRSAVVFFQELTEQYAALIDEQLPCLMSPSIQPADHALWQRQWLQTGILTPQLDYWTQKLSGSLPILQLPTDHPRPAVQTFRGARQPFALSSEIMSALKNLAAQENATLFMVLLTAFKTLLYRYTRQTDLLVGSPIANRNRSNLAQSIGFFVNTLVLRSHLSSNSSFRSLLRQVRQVALEAYSHADLPFEKLVEALQPQRDLSYSPLFQVMFDLQSLPTHLKCADLTLQLSELETGTAKFDLTLSIVETQQGLQGHWEYNADLFESATIHRMMGHFETLLSGILADPDIPLAQLPLLTAPERQQLLVDWNQTDFAVPDRAFHHLFEAQVEQTPNEIAVIAGDQQLTYQALNQRVNQLAHYLQTCGVKPDGLVGICLERSGTNPLCGALDLLIGLLAVLKAGGAYVPLDPTYPSERLAFMLADSQVPILLTQERLLPHLPSQVAQVVCLDRDASLIAEFPTSNPETVVTLSNLAYVIYTSGSTGKPKGTLIEHRGLVNYLTWCIQAYPVAFGTGSPVHSSISFDMTITGLFSPLMVGRSVELLPEHLGIEALATALRHNSGYSLVKITPAQLELLSHQLSPTDVARRTQAFIIGGENLRSEQLEFWQKFAPQTQLINEYGPTETVVGCCVYTVAPNDPLAASVPIGRPIYNTQLYILDAELQPVPIGVVGELYIGGVGVARGYLNRPELTAERFVANPFSHEVNARLYRTGDLVRYRADGVIEFLGRLDHQVKIRGYRIELGEIEAALTQHPMIQEAIVIARDSESGHQDLVAYMIPTANAELKSNEIRDALKNKLPEYMLPSAFVVLETLPLTVNGKVDRQALPPPSSLRPVLTTAYVAPQAELEQAIAQIWQTVLQLDRVGIQDNFFDLGGHSLRVMQVQSQLQERLGREIAVVDLFQHPTIQALAAYFSQDSRETAVFGAVQDQVNRQKAALNRRKQLMSKGGQSHG